jgi:tetratricopeptide (TPR) repeat protein
LAGPALPFGDETLGPEQAPWLALLENGVLPVTDCDTPPAAYMIEDGWRELLEGATRSATGNHWLAWLHLGVMHLAESRLPEARRAWERSLELGENAWALRNLARLAALDGRGDEAVGLYRRALKQVPDDWRLIAETAECLVQLRRPLECLATIEQAPAGSRSRGRLRLLEARAAADVGDLDRFEAIARDGFVLEDAREGEGSPSDVWFDYRAKRLARDTGQPVTAALRERVRREFAPPPAFDYRMSAS